MLSDAFTTLHELFHPDQYKDNESIYQQDKNLKQFTVLIKT